MSVDAKNMRRHIYLSKMRGESLGEIRENARKTIAAAESEELEAVKRNAYLGTRYRRLSDSVIAQGSPEHSPEFELKPGRRVPPLLLSVYFEKPLEIALARTARLATPTPCNTPVVSPFNLAKSCMDENEIETFQLSDLSGPLSDINEEEKAMIKEDHKQMTAWEILSPRSKRASWPM